VSRDARESLTALICVSLFFGFFYLWLRVLDRFPMPRWLGDGLMAINLLWGLGLLVRAFWRRRRDGAAAGGQAELP
jgi:hypothetical protein